MFSRLIDIQEKMKKYRNGELSVEETKAIDKRLAESYERMREYDKEIEKRIKAREVTQELLRKSCNL